MEKYAIAVKALIVRPEHTWLGPRYDEVLVLENALDDPYRPGESDLPGGRLEPGEDPYVGLKRELTEELGEEAANAIEIGRPLDVAHFERPDGQTVTMIFFHCELKKPVEIKISPEHSAYDWVDIDKFEKVVHGHFIDKMQRAVQRL